MDPGFCLFKTNDKGNVYYPNENSFINPYHLNYFYFFGRLMGKALSS